MKLQLPESPVLKQFTTTVPAEYYNPIRLAQLHQRDPVELLLGGRGLSVCLDRESWLVTDRNLGEIPVLAWTGFRPSRRAGLHCPAPCELIYYHAYAAVVIRTVLPEVVARLAPTEPRAEGPAPLLTIHNPA